MGNGGGGEGWDKSTLETARKGCGRPKNRLLMMRKARIICTLVRSLGLGGGAIEVLLDSCECRGHNVEGHADEIPTNRVP